MNAEHLVKVEPPTAPEPVTTLDELHADGVCRWCGDPILWTSSSKGHRVPVNPVPMEGGPVFLLRHLNRANCTMYDSRVVAGPDVVEATRFERHSATCTRGR